MFDPGLVWSNLYHGKCVDIIKKFSLLSTDRVIIHAQFKIWIKFSLIFTSDFCQQLNIKIFSHKELKELNLIISTRPWIWKKSLHEVIFKHGTKRRKYRNFIMVFAYDLEFSRLIEQGQIEAGLFFQNYNGFHLVWLSVPVQYIIRIQNLPDQ